MAAYLGQFLMSFRDQSGNYYSATQNYTGEWSITWSPALSYVQTLPQGWAETNIVWARDTQYMGVFRSLSSNTYGFIKGERAILQYAFRNGGLQAYLKITVYIWNEASFDYDIFYVSCIDFTAYKDNIQTEILEVQMLDCDLMRDVHAYGDTQYNIPVWVLRGGAWELNADAWVNHTGIKSLYSSTWRSAATATSPLIYASVYIAGGLQGFNLGHHDTGDTIGFHTIVPMSQYNPVQNNGATTFIGNTLLQTQLLQGSQSGLPNEIGFTGNDESKPFTKNNYAIKNLLNSPSGQTHLYGAVSGRFCKAGSTPPFDDAFIHVPTDGTGQAIRFVLFEVGPYDVAAAVPGSPQIFQPIELLSIPLPDTGGDYIPNQFDFSNYAGGTIPLTETTSGSVPPSPITLKNGYVYIFSIIWDNDGGTSLGINVGFSDLQFSIFSNYNYGSAPPVDAPISPASPAAAFRLDSIFKSVIKNLPTTNTDLYGFPLPVNTPFDAVSQYLGDSQPAVYDCKPAQLLLTSGYCIHHLPGQSYITISLNQAFDLAKKVLGCGAGIENDAAGNPTVWRVEKMDYFFDNTTCILDLGFDVEGLEVTPFSIGVGSNLKLGYTKVQTNSNFGVDSFNTEEFFNTPLSMMPGTIDLEVNSVVTDMYAIEITRIQQEGDPTGTVIDPGSPSTDNVIIALYVQDTQRSTVDVQDPSSALIPNQPAYLLNQHADAQNRYENATGGAYINGLYYPDTAYNLEISPKRNLMRIGNLLHSYFYNLDDKYLPFRNTALLQIVNMQLKAVGLAGIESNLVPGGPVINEFSDVKIGDLPPQLFKPVIIKFKSRYPVNMYSIINNNPRGYVQCKWMDSHGRITVYKGFIAKVEQQSNGAATEFQLWATPDMAL